MKFQINENTINHHGIPGDTSGLWHVKFEFANLRKATEPEVYATISASFLHKKNDSEAGEERRRAALDLFQRIGGKDHTELDMAFEQMSGADILLRDIPLKPTYHSIKRDKISGMECWRPKIVLGQEKALEIRMPGAGSAKKQDRKWFYELSLEIIVKHRFNFKINSGGDAVSQKVMRSDAEVFMLRMQEAGHLRDVMSYCENWR